MTKVFLERKVSNCLQLGFDKSILGSCFICVFLHTGYHRESDRKQIFPGKDFKNIIFSNGINASIFKIKKKKKIPQTSEKTKTKPLLSSACTVLILSQVI